MKQSSGGSSSRQKGVWMGIHTNQTGPFWYDSFSPPCITTHVSTSYNWGPNPSLHVVYKYQIHSEPDWAHVAENWKSEIPLIESRFFFIQFPMAVISRKRLELAARKLRSRSSCRVPHGYVPMYVGEEHKLYEVPVECLSSVMLQALLIQFEEEIPANGPIALSCSLQMFEWVMGVAMAEKTGHELWRILVNIADLGLR